MDNKKRIVEIFLYVLLLIAGLFSYYVDVDIGLYKEIESQNHEEISFDEVPNELIDYNFKFEGD